MQLAGQQLYKHIKYEEQNSTNKNQKLNTKAEFLLADYKQFQTGSTCLPLFLLSLVFK